MHPLPRSETVIRKLKRPSLYLNFVYSSSKEKRKNGWRFDRCCHRAKASARETLRRKRLTYCGWRRILTSGDISLFVCLILKRRLVSAKPLLEAMLGWGLLKLRSLISPSREILI